MYISLDEFMLLAIGNGNESIKGFEGWIENVDVNSLLSTKSEDNSFIGRMEDIGMLEQKKNVDSNDSVFVVSALAQLYIEIMCTPDAWIQTVNHVSGLRRNIYVRDFYFLCLDIENEYLKFTLVPTIELLIGAYAQTWPEGFSGISKSCTETDWNPDKTIYSLSGYSRNGPIDICICETGLTRKSVTEKVEYSDFSLEKHTNAVTKWFTSVICVNKE